MSSTTEQKQQHDEHRGIDSHQTTTTASTKKQTKFIPNIVQHKRKGDFTSPEKILSPTQSLINNNNKSNGNSNDKSNKLPLIPPPSHINSSSSYDDKQPPIPPPTTTTSTDKPVILKIKRKIDDDPLPSIVIERPKKKAFLDTFKDFNIKEQQDKEEKEEKERQEKEKQEEQVPLVDKKRFTLISTFEERNVNTNHLQTKIQQRLEEFKNKSGVSSPKLLEAKKEKINKTRKESRYKQISINRNAFSAEEKEFFSVHEVIELERTTEKPTKKKLSKEEEALICNYKSLLVEHFNVEKKREEAQQPKYVYDYYVFYPTIHHSHPMDMEEDEEEIVTLPPEDDFMDNLDAISEGGSSDDSENWYREYPSGEESYSEEDDEYDKYHRDSHDDFYEDYEDDYDSQPYYRDDDDYDD
ncbi:hypothetical protein CYY_007762 [Polysphondylium violaceum]|uniref:RNA polymerase II nuclear localization protein SLC7A6OS n=1 Tax=Polysphondylium violaceum TaxID=133409 RepID=A0A8J4UXU2_9MYCE|nr:hypothetical protein CYY_007762 [Polysphondylium violaceum]